MSEWAAILTPVGALLTAAGLLYAALNARKKTQGDTALAITEAAEKIVTMQRSQIEKLEAKIREREADVTILREKIVDREKGLDALNAKLDAREKDVQELRMKVQRLYRYVEYLHKFIGEKGKKKPLSLEEYNRREAQAQTHFEKGL